MNRTNGAGSRTDDAVLKLFNDKELLSTTVKLKTPRKPTQKKPTTNWKERAKQLENQDDKPSPTKTSPGPVVTQLDEKDISTFATGRPLLDEPEYKVCKYCKKPILKSVAAEHVRACLKAKAERTKERKKQREEAAAAAAGEKSKKR